MANNKIKQVPYKTEEVARADSNMFDGIYYRDRVIRKLRALPVPTDDLSEELGLEVYDSMMNDPQISSAIHTAAYQILSQGMQVIPSHPNPSSPEHKKSVEVADFIKRMMEYVGGSGEIFGPYMARSYNDILMDSTLRRFQYGNNAAEMTLTVPKTGKLANMATLQWLSPKHPKTVQYVVDRHGKIPYLLVWTGKNEPPKISGNESRQDLIRWGWKLIRASKFFIQTHRPMCGDPRGISALRAAYSSWYMLQNIWPEYHKYLVQFASGILKGTLAENAQAIPDSSGNIIKPLDKMSAALEQLSNGSYIALEHDNDVEVIRPDGDGSAFRLAIDTLNNQIVKSILHSVLATNTSQNQSRAASAVHKDISDLPAISTKASICQAQRTQIWRPLVALNFGMDAAEMLTPTGSLGRITPEDRAMVVSSYAAAGYKMSPSQMQYVSGELEIPGATPEEMKAMMDTFKGEGQKQGLEPGAKDKKTLEQRKQRENTKNKGEQA